MTLQWQPRNCPISGALSVPASPGLIYACNLIKGFDLFLPAAFSFAFTVYSRTRVPGRSPPALGIVSTQFCLDRPKVVASRALVVVVSKPCAIMFRSPGISSYLGAFKFSEKQGKARETANAPLCSFCSVFALGPFFSRAWLVTPVFLYNPLNIGVYK